MSQAFYRKWRPRLWNQVIEQEHVVNTIKNAIRSGRIGHAYLFAGPRGTGKTTTARLLAKAVNCMSEDLTMRPCDHCAHCQAVNDNRFLDLIEIDAASNTSVDDIRDLRDKINFSPSQGVYKVYIIDEVHMLSTAAFNALLKTLEEPPSHAIFILATTEIYKIPATVLSRCQRYEFRRISVNGIKDQLDIIVKDERLEADTDALILIARQSSGSLRDAISLLDQIASTGMRITLKTTQEILGTATNLAVMELMEAILDHQVRRGLDVIHKSLESGSDPRQFARQVVEYLRSLLLICYGNSDQVDATMEIRQQMQQQATRYSQTQLLEAIRQFNNAATDRRSGWYPGLLLEMALVEVIEDKHISQGITAADSLSMTEANKRGEKRDTSKNIPTTIKMGAQKSDIKPAGDAEKTKVFPQQEESGSVDLHKTSSLEEKITYEDIEKNWNRIKEYVKTRRSSTVGLLNSCKYKTLREGTLVLGFASDVLKQKMESVENLSVAQQAITQVMGFNIPITCIVLNEKAKLSYDKLDTEGDGMVGEALNLGGKIARKE